MDHITYIFTTDMHAGLSAVTQCCKDYIYMFNWYNNPYIRKGKLIILLF